MNLGVDKIEKADTFALQVMWSRGNGDTYADNSMAGLSGHQRNHEY